MIEPDARVLAIVVARIGDTLLVTPALRALATACPAGTLTVLAHPKRLDLLRHLPFIERLGGITGGRARLRSWLARRRHDYAFVWSEEHELLRYALRAARRVIGFRPGDPALARRLFRAAEKATAPEHAVTERLRLTRALGIDAADLRLAYVVTPAERQAARTWLSDRFPGAPSPLVGLQLQSFPTKAYRDWPLAHFRALGERLLARWPQARLLVFGDAASRAAAAAFCAAFPGLAASLAGTLPLRGSAAMMSLLDLYVGVDTGPTHLAGALGVPMVALYHCRHRGRHLAPLQHPALSVVEHPAADAACSSTSSMAAIGVDRVWQAVTERLCIAP
jgi:heptosyltransferase-3